ncbi:hypothetical protein PAENIP36_64950 [Paenibacillus sp. P36]
MCEPTLRLAFLGCGAAPVSSLSKGRGWSWGRRQNQNQNQNQNLNLNLNQNQNQSPSLPARPRGTTGRYFCEIGRFRTEGELGSLISTDWAETPPKSLK